MEERYLKLRELLTEEETSKKLLELSPEEAVQVLAVEYGLTFTADELRDIVLGIRDAAAERENGELSADDLDRVAGGGKGSEAYNFGKSVGGAMPAVVILVCTAVAFGW